MAWLMFIVKFVSNVLARHCGFAAVQSELNLRRPLMGGLNAVLAFGCISEYAGPNGWCRLAKAYWAGFSSAEARVTMFRKQCDTFGHDVLRNL